jgi:hypothetical protein
LRNLQGQAQGIRPMTPSNTHPLPQALAQVWDVLTTVREEIYKKGLKSSNKHTPSKAGDRNRANDAEDELRSMRQNNDAVTAALNGHAHNCQQLADIASALLREMGFFVTLHSSKPAADHVVVLCSREPLPDLPADRNQWPENVLVCDPWANVACHGSDYSKEFRAKMTKWSNEGKKVWVSPGDDDLDAEAWIDPLRPEWVDNIAGPNTNA